jgi:hypothetical protein
MSSIPSWPAISVQDLAVDALPVHASASQREEDDEIILVEDMTSMTSRPGPSHISNSQMAFVSTSTPLQSEDIIDISDDEPEKSPVKPVEALPVIEPVFSPFPLAETVPSKAKEPLFLPSPSSSPRSAQSLQYPNRTLHTLGGDNVEIEAPWDMPSMDVLDVSMEHPLALGPKRKNKRMEVYVLIPPPPDWVKGAKQSKKGGKQKRKPWIADEEVGDSEIEETEDWDVKEGTTSRRRPEIDTGKADGTTSSFPCLDWTLDSHYESHF